MNKQFWGKHFRSQNNQYLRKMFYKAISGLSQRKLEKVQQIIEDFYMCKSKSALILRNKKG